MKGYCSIVALFCVFTSYAQLYVQPNGTSDTYIYVQDTFVFVEDEIALVSNDASDPAAEVPSIVLREESQLLQGVPGTFNSGSGKVSLFQEGNVNRWDYNFWGAPVGLPTGGAGNTDFQATLLAQPQSKLLSDEINFVGGYESSTSDGGALNLASFWILTFDSTVGNYDAWNQIFHTGTAAAGLGFSMKGVNEMDSTEAEANGVMNNPGAAQRYDFRGRPHNGDINIPLQANGEIMIGNPYPSALDLSYFLLENSGVAGNVITPTNDAGDPVTITQNGSTTGIAYFWESDPSVQSHYLVDYVGGYGTFSPMGSTNFNGVYTAATYSTYNEDGSINNPSAGTGNIYDRRFSPVGQGFFVYNSSATTAKTITFKNDHRIFVQEGNNSDFKSASTAVPAQGVRLSYNDVTSLPEVPHFKLRVNIYDTYTRELAMAFLDDSTFSADIAMDAIGNGVLGTDITLVVDETPGYVISATPFDEEEMYPLHMQVAEETATFQFTADNFVNFNTEELYLWDAAYEVAYDLLDEPFSLELEVGDYTDRFFIIFKAMEDETLSTTTVTASSFEVTFNKEEAALKLHNPTGVEITNIEMLDLNGRSIYSSKEVGIKDLYTIATESFSDAIYILKYKTAQGAILSQKVLVPNR